VGRQLVAMRMRMGIVPRGKRRFGLRMVGGVGMRVIERVVLILFEMTFLVLAGMRGEMFL
jgi:hypothetical protein